METLANGIGIIGAGLFLFAYFLLQRGALSGQEPRYLWLNLVGAVMILFSLIWFWNLPAFLVESAWAVISVQSLVKAGRKA